jgi:SAM-dependent methyltransferase
MQFETVNNSSKTSCRSCGAALEHTFVDLGMTPLANSYIKSAQQAEMEPFYSLHVQVCSKCFLVQLPSLVRPEDIFSDYAYFSSYSDSWLEHAKIYTDEVTRRFGLDASSQVVEIASNDGYLLQYFLAKDIPVLGIEPARNVAEEAIRRGIPTQIRFFGTATARDLIGNGIRANLIIGNNVLAHVPDLNDFVSGLKLLLRPDGVITLEFPHLMTLMDENQFDTIYHEHFSYFSLTAALHLIQRHTLRIFDVDELPTHGGSLRIYVCHTEDERVTDERVEKLLCREKIAGFESLAHYASFEEQVKETKRSLLHFLISSKRAGKSIAGYGAPAKGNTLLNYCGIRSDFLDYTVDRSPHKQGCFLPGIRIPIYHPDKVKETKPDYLLILPWNLRSEIMSQMAYIKEWGGQFVVPIPTVKVYS